MWCSLCFACESTRATAAAVVEPCAPVVAVLARVAAFAAAWDDLVTLRLLKREVLQRLSWRHFLPVVVLENVIAAWVSVVAHEAIDVHAHAVRLASALGVRLHLSLRLSACLPCCWEVLLQSGHGMAFGGWARPRQRITFASVEV